MTNEPPSNDLLRNSPEEAERTWPRIVLGSGPDSVRVEHAGAWYGFRDADGVEHRGRLGPPSGTPERTADGRPYFREVGDADDPLALWLPSPPRHGDAVYCQGVQVGTVRGDLTTPGGGCIEALPSAQMPARVAAHVRATSTRTPPLG
jgi:hypothetical protein